MFKQTSWWIPHVVPNVLNKSSCFATQVWYSLQLSNGRECWVVTRRYSEFLRPMNRPDPRVAWGIYGECKGNMLFFCVSLIGKSNNWKIYSEEMFDFLLEPLKCKSTHLVNGQPDWWRSPLNGLSSLLVLEECDDPPSIDRPPLVGLLVDLPFGSLWYFDIAMKNEWKWPTSRWVMFKLPEDDMLHAIF